MSSHPMGHFKDDKKYLNEESHEKESLTHLPRLFIPAKHLNADFAARCVCKSESGESGSEKKSPVAKWLKTTGTKDSVIEINDDSDNENVGEEEDVQEEIEKKNQHEI
jgi:hypothetical protein